MTASDIGFFEEEFPLRPLPVMAGTGRARNTQRRRPDQKQMTCLICGASAYRKNVHNQRHFCYHTGQYERLTEARQTRAGKVRQQ